MWEEVLCVVMRCGVGCGELGRMGIYWELVFVGIGYLLGMVLIKE